MQSYDRIVKIFEELAAENSCRPKKDNRGRQEILCVLGVFQKMHELKIKPNVITFSAILNACSLLRLLLLTQFATTKGSVKHSKCNQILACRTELLQVYIHSLMLFGCSPEQ
ncbi:hypothetical protein U1Q18_006706 [Sarracenia purpurea var. burkii]